MEVLGIKCEMAKLSLLKEFFAQMGNPMDLETRIGLFVPTGAVHSIGPEAYTNLICDNNTFLTSVTTLPIGDFQHETLDIPFSLDKSTDIDQTTLYELIMEQTWCISVEKTITKNKVLIVTTRGQLLAAQTWFDDTFLTIYEDNISDKIDVTTLQHMLPCRLDKPLLTAASMSYAAKLKLRTSCTTSSNQRPTQFTRPPRAKPHRPVVAFDAESFPPLKQQSKHPPKQPQNSPAESRPPAEAEQTTTTYDYKADLQRITTELESTLQTKFEKALAALDEKFEKRMKAIEQQFARQFKQLKPLVTNQAELAMAQAELKATQSDQAKDISQLTKNMSTLMSKVSSILNRLPLLPEAASHPTLANSVGRS